MEVLSTITQLSHEFGGDDFVKGGGGNTSCKDAEKLWVKPSGTTLAGMSEDAFVVLERQKINALYAAETPAEASAREELVKTVMAEAVVPGSSGRPSVEAPLHNVFDAVYVVHTHPAWVNGMTCAKNGAAVCARLFPEAMWVDYIDPGYTLCMAVRNAIEDWKTEKGREPEVLFLKNHGVFIAADTAERIRERYRSIMDALKAEYDRAGIDPGDRFPPAPEGTEADAVRLREVFGADAAGVAAGGRFPVVDGPISPDHIVYAKSFPFRDEITPEKAEAFKARHGYAPRVVVTERAVFGLGSNQKNAGLALTLAQDGALVARLTEAFGGLEPMTDQAREFIENWEVESYRQKVAASE
jgi:rhamnose utilization protein RhaD (predicted bifunctional aldolase and dehydrogenase)